MAPSPFEMLLDDLAAVQALRTTQTPSRDTAARNARHAAEARRNRRMARPQPQRTLRKSAPLPYRAPDWDSLSARQGKIAAEMEQTRVQQQKDAIREHLRLLAVAARAGRLTAHEAALFDVYTGQALAMGLEA